MNWSSFEQFAAMGGYGLYVWGAFGVTALVMLGEVRGLRARRDTLRRVVWDDDCDGREGREVHDGFDDRGDREPLDHRKGRESLEDRRDLRDHPDREPLAHRKGRDGFENHRDREPLAHRDDPDALQQPGAAPRPAAGPGGAA